MRDPRYVLNASHTEAAPVCFNSKAQYTEYLNLKRLSKEAHLFRGVCHDCTPEYKARMLAEGRCDHPETVFVQLINRSFETETIGVASNHKFWPRVKRGQMVFKLFREGDSDGED